MLFQILLIPKRHNMQGIIRDTFTISQKMKEKIPRGNGSN